jgi:hypothetical protein
MVPIGTNGKAPEDESKLAHFRPQGLPIEPLSDPDLAYFVLFVFFVVNFFLRGEKVFVSVCVRPCGSVANFFLLPAASCQLSARLGPSAVKFLLPL